MAAPSIELLAKYWFEELGCKADDFNVDAIVVTTHGPTLAGYSGAIAFKHQGSCILSVPSDCVDDLREKTQGLTVGAFFCRESLVNLFGNAVDQVIGPAWIGKVSADHFYPCHSNETRLLTRTDRKSFDQFLAKNDKIEVEHSALASGREPTVGVFYEGELVAAASYDILGGRVAHIGVLSSQASRGRGFAKKAVSLITQIALGKGLGIQYRTLKENTASIRVAQAVGFEEFAETFSVRFISLGC